MTVTQSKVLDPSISVRRAKINSLPDDNISTLSKFKAFADDDFNMVKIGQIFFDWVENILGKNRKC